MRHPSLRAAGFDVSRLAFGTMQLTGPGYWGPPADPDAAVRVLRRCVELGIDHFDTAEAYGPAEAETLVRRALHPYTDLLIATKGGLTRQGPHRWTPVGHPALLRQSVEMSLRRLAVDHIDLYYLHRLDPAFTLADQLGVLTDMVAEGKLRHIGLSKVGVDVLEQARALAPVAAVQNRLHVGDRSSLDVVTHCESHGIAFVAYEPLGVGNCWPMTASSRRRPSGAPRPPSCAWPGCYRWAGRCWPSRARPRPLT